MRHWLAVALVCLGGCAGAQEYRLQVGDKLKIVIFDELNEQVIVRPDHKISVPILGEFSTRRKTPAQLSEELSQGYQMPTVVMVQEVRTWPAQVKEGLGLVRDIALVAFAVLRLANE